MPDLVPAEDLMNALALSSAQFNLGRFLGPALAALVLAAWTVDVAFYINAVSFLFVIVALMLVRTETPPYPPPPEGMWSHIREGLGYVWRHDIMVSILVVGGIAGFFGFSFMVLAPGFARDVLHHGAGGYGILLLSYGFGAMVGAPLVTYLRQKVSEPVIIRWSLMGVSLTMLAISLSRNYWLTCALAVFSGLGFLMMSTACNAALQSRSDREMRGRVISLYIMVSIGIFPIGGQVLGWFSDITSAPWALGLAGAACMATSLALIVFPGLMRDEPGQFAGLVAHD
jgi:MFS family permease